MTRREIVTELADILRELAEEGHGHVGTRFRPPWPRFRRSRTRSRQRVTSRRPWSRTMAQKAAPHLNSVRALPACSF